MLKDVTLGQYINNNSVIHKLDSRIKIVGTFILLIASFFCQTAIQYSALFAFLIICILLTKIRPIMYIKTLKPMLYLIIFTGLLNMFLIQGEYIYLWGIRLSKNGLILTGLMFLRVSALVVISAFLTYTTSPSELTFAIEKLFKPLTILKFPAHEIAMMMSIALRFIPTLIDETEKIIKAQTARGANFTSGNLIKRAKSMIVILIPLFISAFKRADDLAIAMEARGYKGGKGRTSFYNPKLSTKDFVCLASSIIICVIIYII